MFCDCVQYTCNELFSWTYSRPYDKVLVSDKLLASTLASTSHCKTWSSQPKPYLSPYFQKLWKLSKKRSIFVIHTRKQFTLQ